MKIVFLNSELEVVDSWSNTDVQVPRRGDTVEIFVSSTSGLKKQYVVENVIWNNEGVVCHVE